MADGFDDIQNLSDGESGMIHCCHFLFCTCLSWVTTLVKLKDVAVLNSNYGHVRHKCNWPNIIYPVAFLPYLYSYLGTIMRYFLIRVVFMRLTHRIYFIPRPLSWHSSLSSLIDKLVVRKLIRSIRYLVSYLFNYLSDLIGLF